jgi:hypothetical protein
MGNSPRNTSLGSNCANGLRPATLFPSLKIQYCPEIYLGFQIYSPLIRQQHSQHAHLLLDLPRDTQAPQSYVAGGFCRRLFVEFFKQVRPTSGSISPGLTRAAYNTRFGNRSGWELRLLSLDPTDHLASLLHEDLILTFLRHPLLHFDEAHKFLTWGHGA